MCSLALYWKTLSPEERTPMRKTRSSMTAWRGFSSQLSGGLVPCFSTTCPASVHRHQCHKVATLSRGTRIAWTFKRTEEQTISPPQRSFPALLKKHVVAVGCHFFNEIEDVRGISVCHCLHSIQAIQWNSHPSRSARSGGIQRMDEPYDAVSRGACKIKPF